MELPRERVVELLRRRDDHEDADRAERELPDTAGPDRDAGFLTTFGVHPHELVAGLSGKVLGL